MTPEEMKELQAKVVQQIRSGKSLTGKDGAFAPMIKQFLETALEAELNEHLDEEERGLGNKRNGYKSKQVKSSSGTVEIETPQDRLSSFSPEIVKKRETILADSLEEKIIGLYGLGMSLRDISAHIEEMYGTKVSASTLSEITDRIIPKVKEWQQRPIAAVYAIIWMDAMFYKVRDDGRVTSRSVYNILGVRLDGRKEVLGCYVAESEGARFWLQVMTDLKNRGLEDILIASIDNLKGFSEAIASIFPHTEIQSCIVHQIRNSIKYVGSKNQKTFMRDLKKVYQAINKEAAEDALLELDEKWGKQYPVVIRSWNDNWEKLSTFFKYDSSIRKLIYTTNAVEGYHRQIRKVTKTKGAFTSDMALLKLIYLASNKIEEKWTQPLPNWATTVQQLVIHFEGRVPLNLW